MTSRILVAFEMGALFLLLYLGVPWVGLQIDRLLRIPSWPSPIPWIGLGLAIVGVAGLTWCFVLFARVGRGTPNPTRPPQVLVTVGPYKWSRNPIALFHAAALTGLSLFLGSVSAFALVVLLSVPVHFGILREERTLEARFGDVYRAYKASVPRWIPAWGKRQS